MRVFITDDSITFRTQIRKALEEIDGVQVCGVASNGRIALRQLEVHPADLMILDINMPEMDGLATLEALQAQGNPIKVLVFSAKSARSARDTIKALSLGAVDFVVKPEGETFSADSALEQVKQQLVPKVRQFMHQSADGTPLAAASGDTSPAISHRIAHQSEKATLSVVGNATGVENRGSSFKRVSLETFRPQVVVLASSTGGPSALDTIFKTLKGHHFKVPVLIAQHMPETFTRFLAARLQELSGIECREALHGEQLKPGAVLVAPGNFHMRLVARGPQVFVELDQGPRVNSVRPAADLLFTSAARIFGRNTMGFVLTGMGSDGLAGSCDIKQAGGAIMIQNRESCVVWGMPAAVHGIGAHDREGDLAECARVLMKLTS